MLICASAADTPSSRAGFEALCTSDASFLPFKRTLFARSSLELERDACTQEQVAKLAASITRFLHLLVPHFATSAATMALEYLVRKYRCARKDHLPLAFPICTVSGCRRSACCVFAARKHASARTAA